MAGADTQNNESVESVRLNVLHRQIRPIEFSGLSNDRQPFWRFLVETSCVLGLFFVFWQFAKLVHVPLLSSAIEHVVKAGTEADMFWLYGTTH
jgi:hypothetical protein